MLQRLEDLCGGCPQQNACQLIYAGFTKKLSKHMLVMSRTANHAERFWLPYHQAALYATILRSHCNVPGVLVLFPKEPYASCI